MFFLRFFLLITFWSYIYNNFSWIKIHKEVTKQYESRFSYYFCLMIENSGTNGWIWIRIQEAQKHTDTTDPDPAPQYWCRLKTVITVLYCLLSNINSYTHYPVIPTHPSRFQQLTISIFLNQICLSLSKTYQALVLSRKHEIKKKYFFA